MSKAALKQDKGNTFGGVVLTSTGDGWKRPTGVFLPDPTIVADRNLTVILWFHGHRVPDIPYLFYQEETKILQAVLASKKRVVLVAPHLGLKNTSVDKYNASVLGGGKACEQYLDQVLEALSDWYLSTLIDLDPKPTKKYEICELYIAGHSGGGTGIRSSVAALGGYREKLRECWGFDCLYAAGDVWYAWARSQGRMPLYFYFGRGTQPAAKGDVIGLWKRVYGTPRDPLPIGGRMLSVKLAPALPGAEMDTVAFQLHEDIKNKRVASNRYEEVRKEVDPLLDNPSKYWSTIIARGLKDHYPVVSEFLGPRIGQSIY